MVECAEKIFQNQVRIGQPLNISGLTDYVQKPYCSTVIGLLHYGKQSLLNDDGKDSNKSSLKGIAKRLTGWFKKEF